MSKPIPGPWEIEDFAPPVNIFQRERDMCVCLVGDEYTDYSGEGQDELEATARLIQAAPQLLELAQEAAPILRDLGKGKKPDAWVLNNLAYHIEALVRHIEGVRDEVG